MLPGRSLIWLLVVAVATAVDTKWAAEPLAPPAAVATPAPTATTASKPAAETEVQGIKLATSLPPCDPADELDIRVCLISIRNLGNEAFNKNVKNFVSYDEFCSEAFKGKVGSETFQKQCGETFPKLFGADAAAGIKGIKDLLAHTVPEFFCFDKVKANRKGVIEERCKQVSASGLPRCVFFHGVGERNAQHPNLEERYRHPAHMIRTFKDYWGDLHTRLTPICEPLFYWTETRKRGWNNMSLMKEYCSVIDLLYPSVIFTHSMGNLVVANGFATSLPGCNRISRYNPESTVAWYGIQGPLRGAPGNQLLQRYCKKFASSKFLTKKLSRCIEDGLMEPAYASMVPSFFDKSSKGNLFCPTSSKSDDCKPLLYIASTLQRGSMCGLDPSSGLKKRTDLGLSVLAFKTHFEVKNDADWDPRKVHYPDVGNDGMVSFTSCRVRAANGEPMIYKTEPMANYYALKGNHGDGTCRFGDGKKPNLKPCVWIVNMVIEAMQLRSQALGRIQLEKTFKPQFRQTDMHVFVGMLH